MITANAEREHCCEARSAAIIAVLNAAVCTRHTRVPVSVTEAGKLYVYTGLGSKKSGAVKGR
jgi:hypothetical protein